MLARFEPVGDVSAREVHKCSDTKMSLLYAHKEKVFT